MRIKFLTSPS